MQLQMYPFDRQKCELIIESCEYSTFHFSNLQFQQKLYLYPTVTNKLQQF